MSLEEKEIKSSHLLLPSDSSLLLLYVRQEENLIPCRRPWDPRRKLALSHLCKSGSGPNVFPFPL